MISEWLEAGQEEIKQMKDKNLPGKIESAELNFITAKYLYPDFINNFHGFGRPLVAFITAILFNILMVQ